MQVPNETTENYQNVHQTRFILTMNIINTITHILLGAVAFGAILFANIVVQPASLKIHIYLCVIGYVILMAQAILSLNPYNGWSNVLTYDDKKICHWVMQILGSILAIVGSILRITDRRSGHTNTAHGILGITAMVLTFLSLVGGIINIYSSRMNINVTFTRICHAGLGCLVILTSFLALMIGFNDLYRIIYGDANATLMIAMTVLALIGTSMSASTRLFSRTCNTCKP